VSRQEPRQEKKSRTTVLLFILAFIILLCAGISILYIFVWDTSTGPSAPTLSSPEDSAMVNGTSITFKWQASEGATKYCLRIGIDPSLKLSTAFWNHNIGDVTQHTFTEFPDDNPTVYYWGVYAYNGDAWSEQSDVVKNGRSFTRKPTLYEVSLTPKFDNLNERILFLLLASAKEPVNLDVWSPNGELLAQVYTPPRKETWSIADEIDLPPVPIGGTYRFDMYSDVTGELVWKGEQEFKGPQLEVLDFSLNPIWEKGLGWNLQYLTAKVANIGDMPIILDGLKLRLEWDGFSTQEITLNRSGDDGAVYGWYRTEGYRGLLPYSESESVATIAPWGSNEQNLFEAFFPPGEYLLYFTLSDHLDVLETRELLFE